MNEAERKALLELWRDVPGDWYWSVENGLEGGYVAWARLNGTRTVYEVDARSTPREAVACLVSRVSKHMEPPMTTTEQEQAALPQFWRDVPECRPDRVVISECGSTSGYDLTLPGYIEDAMGELYSVTAALARDAIVEWLLSKRRSVGTARETDDDDNVCGFSMYINERWIMLDRQEDQPTRLLALIAAARAVKGLPPSAPSSPST